MQSHWHLGVDLPSAEPHHDAALESESANRASRKCLSPFSLYLLLSSKSAPVPIRLVCSSTASTTPGTHTAGASDSRFVIPAAPTQSGRRDS